MKKFTIPFSQTIISILSLYFLISTLFFHVGCNRKDDLKDKMLTALIVQSVIPKVDGIEFEHLTLPVKQEDFFTVRVSPRARIRYNNGTYSKYFNLEYKTLYRTGDTDIYQNTVGAIKDRNGNNILESDGSARISVQPDGNTIFLRNGKFHLMTHFENYPGVIYTTELARQGDGSYHPKRFQHVDFSSIGGTAFLCAASQSPWDTHLAGEEDYIFDSYYYDSTVTALFGSHVKLLHVSRAPCSSVEPWTCEQWSNMRSYTGVDYTQLNPYNYGYILEVSADNNANATVKRHYSMGKFTPELAVMMPDKRTAYMSDDGSFSGFYMYVSDREGDLSSGTLYMAKWTQTSPYSTNSVPEIRPATYPDGSPTVEGDTSNGGTGALTWVRLGSATDAAIKTIIDKRPTLSDIFEIGNVGGAAGAGTAAACSALGVGFKLIAAGSYDIEYRGINICLRLRHPTYGGVRSGKFATDAEVLTAAAFLETRKYGSYLGGTTEFEKEEGVVYNPDTNVLYIAMGRLRFGMDVAGGSAFGPGRVTVAGVVTDVGGDDHIQLDRNDCGAIYQVSLGSSQRDTTNNLIASNYVATEMRGILSGRRLFAGEPFADKNRCHPEYISLPDALSYHSGTLYIGEDSSSHFNNAAWAYDVRSGRLTRIMTIPPGSEITGNFAILEDGNRFNIFVNVQHPYGEEIFDGNTEQPINWGYNMYATKEAKRGYVGYIFGLPRITNTTNTSYKPDPNQ
ncbi:MAG: DUF839 domain-containing protein [Leptospiraceae bacterium]|nr:DUF839 domain-containing protein [Leptospiraceae bacterium]